MKKVKGIVIVLLSVMIVGCSNTNSEWQEDNSIAREQQTAKAASNAIIIFPHLFIIFPSFPMRKP